MQPRPWPEKQQAKHHIREIQMHTPEQAKTLWCPMTRLIVHDGTDGLLAVFNRAAKEPDKVTLPPQTACLSNQCAMWRQGPWPGARKMKAENLLAESEDEAGERPGYPAIFWSCSENGDGAASWVETHASIEARRPGYCGIAGAPIL
jgi:hypothetical protein